STKSASQRTTGRECRRETGANSKQVPKTASVFGTPESDSSEPISFFHPDYNCRLRSFTGSCADGRSQSKHSWAVPPIGNSLAVQVSPCPEGYYLIVVIIIPCLGTIAQIPAFPDRDAARRSLAYSALTMHSTGQ